MSIPPLSSRPRKPTSLKAIKQAIAPQELVSFEDKGSHIVIHLRDSDGRTSVVTYDFAADDYFIGDATVSDADLPERPASEDIRQDDAPGKTEPSPHALKTTSVEDAHQTNGEIHLIAQAYIQLTPEEQKNYWRAIGNLAVEVTPGRFRTCRHIGGYQNTDAGPLGAIFADDSDNRHLFAVSFKSGAPFRLSRARPPRRT